MGVCAPARGTGERCACLYALRWRKGLWYSHYMTNEYDDQDFRGWRFDAQLSREAVLERRVKELENIVARLQQDIRSKQLWADEPRSRSISNIAGTIGSQGSIGGVLPASPYKAD